MIFVWQKQQKIRFILFLVLALLTVLSFSPVLRSEFTNWDDPLHTTENPFVQNLSWNDFKGIFTSTVVKAYIPLTILSFAFEYHFVRDHPLVYHLDNLILHIGNVFLIFVLAQRLGLSLRACFLASLLFAIHPMRAESVAWITERKDVLYGFFFLLAILSYLTYLDKKTFISYCLSIVLGLLSMLAKPMALSLPLVLLSLDWFTNRELKRKVFFEKIPFLIYILPILWITYSLNARIPGHSIK